jgi:protein SCO1/2
MIRRCEFLRLAALGPPAFCSVVFAAALTWRELPAWAGAAPLTVGGSFALTAPDGTTVTDKTYRGKWLLVFFGYTFCPDICPTTLNEIAAALDRLGSDAAKLQPLFITVDPERDTPEVMGQFTAAFDAPLSGSPAVRNRSPPSPGNMAPSAPSAMLERATKTISSTIVPTFT